MSREGLSGAERLGSKEINGIFEQGAVGKSHFFIARCLSNNLPYSRLAPIVGKKSGKAAKRNRIKRLIRVLYRVNKQKFPVGYDLVFIARAGVDTAPAGELLAALLKSASRASAEASALSARLSAEQPDEGRSDAAPGGGA